MKKIVLSVLLLSQIWLVNAAEGEIKVKSGIKEVTVFMSGAEVTSVGSAEINSGTSELVFENLSPYINLNTIQATGIGDFVILGVQFRQNHLNQQPKSKEITLLEDSLEYIQGKLDVLHSQRSVSESEENLLLANNTIGGANTGVNAAELDKIANVYRTRLTELKIKQLEIKNKEKKLNEQITLINKQLNELNSKRNRTTGEIVISVSANKGGNAKFTVSYLVSNAGWSPYYDIRAIDSKSPIQLNCRANVYQNTGDDWKNVKLTLSTGNPNQSGTQPIINPWWLNFTAPNYGYDNRLRGARSEAMAPAAAMEKNYDKKAKAEADDYDVEAHSSAQYTTVQENATQFEYEISIPYTIPSENKEHSVEIQTYNVPAGYKYYCAPKLDKDAFLLAQITGWDKYNLMPGNANIYFEGTYVGKSYLNTVSTSDTLDISLGRDKNVIITRTLLKDFSEKKVLGTNKKETFTYEISVRNKKKAEIEIDIEDQVPLTSTNEIEVEVLETSSAKQDKEKGKLIWNMKIAPSETKKVKFGYSIKYPKDKVVSNL